MRYDDYFEISEKAGWRIPDLDWDALVRDRDAGLLSDFDREALLGTTTIEHGVPHYGEVWSLVEGLRAHWELWQFVTLWTGEEHRHSYALKKACTLLGLGDQVAGDLATVSEFKFAELQKASCLDDCYRTVPGMLTYAVIQELATTKFYTLAAKRTASPTLKQLFNLIGTDEMRHHVFYRESLKSLYDAAPDKVWFADQVYRAITAFKMPHVIYQLHVGFFDDGDFDIAPLLKEPLARCFAFDMTLLARLAQDFAADAARIGARPKASTSGASV